APKEKPRAAKKPAPANEPVTATNAVTAMPFKRISVGSVVISNAQARFSDRSLKPNVNLTIEQVNGTIAGLSSEELQHADVDLHARVDNVGPVAITATINPFNE